MMTDKVKRKPGPLKVRPEIAKAIVEALKQNPPPLKSSPESAVGGEGEEIAVQRQKPLEAN